MLHPNAEKQFNKKAYELLAFLEEIKEETNISQKPKGSLGNKIAVDLSDKFDDTKPIIVSDTEGKNKVTIHEIFEGRKIGFNLNNYPNFIKFLKDLYKQQTVSNKIAFDFLYNLTFDWLLSTFKSKRAEHDFCTFLALTTQNATKNLKFSFEVLHIEIEKPFQIGNVLFEFLTPEFFDAHEAKKKLTNPDADITPLREKYQGRVFATYDVHGIERRKAEEVALKECYLAVDVLKLFSPTVAKPEWNISFDISHRVNVHEQNEFIVQDLDKDLSLALNFSSGCDPYRFTEEIIDIVLKASINFVTLIKLRERNELQQLVINSLGRFSEAITNKNIHRRIVDLFTIWESLLLKDNGTPIMNTVSNYGSKLLKKTVADRKELITFLKEMYEIRSVMVHHAKAKTLDMDKVTRLQAETINLMETFIYFSKHFKTKEALLDEIDNAMHGAFTFR